MRISPLRKEELVEWLTNLNGRICAVDFGTSQEPINDMEPIWASHDCRHELLLWISVTVFIVISSLAMAHVRRGSEGRKTSTHHPSSNVSSPLFSPLSDRESFVPSVPYVMLSIRLATGMAAIADSKI
jgi:hypothetical protein